MSDNLIKTHANRYEYTTATHGGSTKLRIERNALGEMKGGLAFLVDNGGREHSNYVFVKAEDVDGLIAAMQEMRKVRCEHCRGEGTV
jgi:hypothetical protein